MPLGFRKDGTKLGFQKGNLPWNKNKQFSNEIKEKMRTSAIERCKRYGLPKCGFQKGHKTWNKGKKFPKRIRKKMSISAIKRYKRDGLPKRVWKKGHKTWNKDLTKDNDKRVAKYGRTLSKAKRQLFKEGKLKAWNKGLTKKIDERLRKYGKKVSKTKRKQGALVGNKNPTFNNWSSREPYGIEFGPDLRLIIRFRDNFTCQLCKTKENGREFTVHHIDYSKINNSLDNLISLCNICHGKTNFNRKHWTNYFQNLMAGN